MAAPCHSRRRFRRIVSGAQDLRDWTQLRRPCGRDGTGRKRGNARNIPEADGFGRRGRLECALSARNLGARSRNRDGCRDRQGRREHPREPGSRPHLRIRRGLRPHSPRHHARMHRQPPFLGSVQELRRRLAGKRDPLRLGNRTSRARRNRHDGKRQATPAWRHLANDLEAGRDRRAPVRLQPPGARRYRLYGNARGPAPVARGDLLEGWIEGIGRLRITII